LLPHARAGAKYLCNPALARQLLGTPKNLQLIDGVADVFGDGSVTLVPTPGHTPGHQSLLVNLKNFGFIILSGDVVHSEDNFERDIVPSLNTNKQDSLASMEKIRQLIATYKATLLSIITKGKRTSSSCSLHSTIEIWRRQSTSTISRETR
jgi:glyoxylase-like metal-dependent hydrolase (beta-lactamase superfamily II)